MDKAKIFLVDGTGQVDNLLTGYDVPLDQKPIHDWRNLAPIVLDLSEEIDIFVQFIELASHELVPDQDLSLLSEIHLPYLIARSVITRSLLPF